MTADCLRSNVGQPVVLCIDDDPQISETIALRLQPYDVEVLRAYHGTHGMWLAMTHGPDLIITDMNMPQGNGIHIVEYVKNNSDTCNTPIIVLTGQRKPELEASARRLGVSHFLTKPVHFDSFVAVIREFIPLKERKEAELLRS
jgi:DNA-binding response OmpR family regulator